MYDDNILFVTAMLVVQNLIPAESSRNPSWHVVKGENSFNHIRPIEMFPLREKLIFDDIWKEVGKEDYFLHLIINLSPPAKLDGGTELWAAEVFNFDIEVHWCTQLTIYGEDG